MLIRRSVMVEHTSYEVVISDEREALLAAKAAGRAFVGVVGRGDPPDAGVVGCGDPPDAGALSDAGELSVAEYAVESPEDADDAYLERVVRRFLGLPWIIAETERLLIREFVAEDAEKVRRESSGVSTVETEEHKELEMRGGAESREDPEMHAALAQADRVFWQPDLLQAYICNQYRFYEYGLWALVRKEDGVIVGKAGLVNADPEMGYHIFTPYRRQGYAEEACRAVMEYAAEQYGLPLRARTWKDNQPSIRLLEKLGFTERHSESGLLLYQYDPNWK